MGREDEFAVVLETASAAELATVQALLDSAEIPYLIAGAGPRLPDLITGRPRLARLSVPGDRAAEVRELLAAHR